jgi:hypothetical protein
MTTTPTTTKYDTYSLQIFIMLLGSPLRVPISQSVTTTETEQIQFQNALLNTHCP